MFSLITACMQIEHFQSEHLSAYLLAELQEYTKKENMVWSIQYLVKVKLNGLAHEKTNNMHM